MSSTSKFDHMTVVVSEEIFLSLKDNYENYAGEKNFRSVSKTKTGEYIIKYRNVRTNDKDYDIQKLENEDKLFEEELNKIKESNTQVPVELFIETPIH